MSGICGLFNLDGAPVSDAELRAMTAMLERRGPEGTHWWHQASIGLGNTLLATTPELQFERQPFLHEATGCVISADVRLDNRDALLDALGIDQRRKPVGDAELILLAYLEWGEDCLNRLLGDFAFAIWDPRQQKLLGARDHFGMRPFYYHTAPEQRFVFASDARAILVLQQVPYAVDQGRIADFIVKPLEWIDYTTTFYEGVFRLPPAHKIMVTPKGVTTSEYWAPQPGPDLGHMSDDDYAQGFLEVFTEAVASRLRAPTGSVASMLSGGIDSGSVVAVGKDVLLARGEHILPTYSAARRPGSDCAESRAIYAAAKMPSIDPTIICPDQVEDIIDELLADIEEPFDAEFMILKAIFLRAREQGQSVVLDGGAGDVVLAAGTYLIRAMRRGRLALAARESCLESRFWGDKPPASYLLRTLSSAMLPDIVKNPLRVQLHRKRQEKALRDAFIGRDFAERVDIAGRLERMRQIFPGGWTPEYAQEMANIVRPNLTAGRERYSRLAASAGTEARDPFLDKRVVDYCTRLPGHLRLKNGWPKMLLRELMEGRLPEEVRWTREKPHLGWLFNAHVTRAAWHRGDFDIAGLQAQLRNYVDPDALALAWRQFHESEESPPVHTAYMLSIWLRKTVKRPVVD